jgi:hypothetical protein
MEDVGLRVEVLRSRYSVAAGPQEMTLVKALDRAHDELGGSEIDHDAAPAVAITWQGERMVAYPAAMDTPGEYSPQDERPGMVGPMFNGRWIWSNDSRFPSSQPVPLFDRWETPEEYASYD